jgi:NitT/TauT family transport system substrate-binding protein
MTSHYTSHQASHYTSHYRRSFLRRQFLKYGALAIGSSIVAACGQNTSPSSSSLPSSSSPASTTALTPVKFGTNWYAQAEHGGFYQAIATGLYQAVGLDVSIQMGGPQVNGTQLLMGGAIDFYMGMGSAAIKAVAENIPKVTVASIFQKDPQVILAHPDTGVKTLADLKGRPIFVSSEASTGYWLFLKAKYGFTDDQKRPYSFNPAPFLADKQSGQQGYLSSEPLEIEKVGKFKPLVFLLADDGYSPYSTTIDCQQSLVDRNPDLVQRFVDASIKGWYSYLKGDPSPGDALIKKDNPKMTDEQLQYSRTKMQEYGIVISGDAETKGIGAMTDDRWKVFFDSLAQVGVFDPKVDYKKAYTLKFVNKGVEAYQS